MKIDIFAMYLQGKAKFQCIADKNLLLGINKSGLPSTLRECLGTEPREDSKRRTLLISSANFHSEFDRDAECGVGQKLKDPFEEQLEGLLDEPRRTVR